MLGQKIVLLDWYECSDILSSNRKWFQSDSQLKSIKKINFTKTLFYFIISFLLLWKAVNENMFFQLQTLNIHISVSFKNFSMGRSAFESVFGLVFENNFNSIFTSVKIRTLFPCTVTYCDYLNSCYFNHTIFYITYDNNSDIFYCWAITILTVIFALLIVKVFCFIS